jgi:membrane protein implicated in regulation of membrane protease activity
MAKHTPIAATRAERALIGSWFATALGLAGVLIPKCPLCVAAYLCLFGVSAGSARAVAKLGLPLCLVLVFVSAFATALFVARRGRRRSRASELHQPPAGASRSVCSCRTS